MTADGPEAEDDPRPYRPCVGLALFNATGEVFLGRRLDVPGEHWQMPQGGIDAGESPEAAALRELREETGTAKAHILGALDDWQPYDLPKEVSHKVWGGRFRGQTQKWFALRFTGTDDDILLDDGVHKPEFDAWRWVALDDVLSLIVPFKRPVYEAVIAGFARYAVPQD